MVMSDHPWCSKGGSENEIPTLPSGSLLGAAACVLRAVLSRTFFPFHPAPLVLSTLPWIQCVAPVT